MRMFDLFHHGKPTRSISRNRRLGVQRLELRELLAADVAFVGPLDAVPAEPSIVEIRSLDDVFTAVQLAPTARRTFDAYAANIAVSPAQADANFDGTVDARDYTIWAQHVFTNRAGSGGEGNNNGDFNGDGIVDGLDYLDWAEQVARQSTTAERLDGWDLASQGVPLPANEAELVATLNMLPPLPKLHHSSPWSFNWENPDLATAVARITGSVGLSTYYHDTMDVVRRAVRIAKETGAVVDFQYSPYHVLYAKSDPRDWGPDFQAALDEINSTFIEAAVNFERAKVLENAPDVRVGIVMADQELLRSDIGPDGKADPDGPHYADQLEAVRIKNDYVYNAAKRAFPDATFVWHSFPGGPYHSPDQLHDGVASTELYTNLDPATLRYAVKDFVDSADAFNAAIEPSSARRPITTLIPAISLGGFYDVSVNEPHPGYITDVPYPVRYSWHKGRTLNHPYFASEERAHRDGPSYRIDELYLWPAPIGNGHDGYYEHLVAYVAGAANLKASEGNWLDTLSR
ncbi:MAG: dockerin type I domain-containing protein [Pirellulales bacterium]